MSKITLYTKDFCPYCVQAKKQLTDMGFEYEEVNIETDAKTRGWLMEQGHRTMPQLYHDGKLLVEGGAQGLAKLSKDEIKTALGEFDFDISMKL
jgi:glutaredoxin 3